MTELNNEPAFHENDNEAHPPAAPRVMFITILLMISGLLLTSVMLIHYGLKSTDENGQPISGLSNIKTMLKSKPAPPQSDPKPRASVPAPQPVEPPENTEKTTSSKPEGFNIKNLFSMAGNGNVRWPRLRLTGFGLPATGEAGFAIINGKHIAEGSTINGVVLVEILAEGVVVQYKGETKKLIVEMTH